MVKNIQRLPLLVCVRAELASGRELMRPPVRTEVALDRIIVCRNPRNFMETANILANFVMAFLWQYIIVYANY